MAKKKKTPKPARRASAAERLDVRVSAAAMRYRDTAPVRAAGLLSKLSDQPPLLAASAGTVVLGLVARRPALVRAGLRALATETLATGMKAVVKRHVARTRPAKMLRDGRYALHPDKDGDKNEGPWNSFPSGHSAGAVGVARAVSREFPEAAPVAAAAAGTVALVQVPKGAHFASDVIAGGAIGLAAEALVNAAARAIRARRRSD